ncbi:unnamed protein product [Clonostachys rosea]|uniref:mitogen-activated protein kinase kinase n=1 Tax=Bionectria ochroleuca TaxID=29856 RepID=A0ABY6UDQ0_BIOOC|nr:unnamed protein product [Clonostachys rosea]
MPTERAEDLARKLSDLVAEARLETSFLDASTQHIYHNDAGGQSVPTRRVENWTLDVKRPVLGSGSFGTVRLERCQQSSRMRAVKEIKKHDQQHRLMDYSRELEAIVQFSRPQYSHCFVQSHGWFENESSIFIAMEYYQWGDLSRHLYSPLPEEEVRQIISQVLEGIVYMHEKGFMHRDLKPSNIMVISNGPYWSVKIADFGISKQRFLQESLNTVGVGTIGYVAPEQIGLRSNDVTTNDDNSTPGFPADMWSIGILSVKLFTGQAPFKDLTTLSQYLSSTQEARVARLESPLKQQGASKVSQKFIVDLLQVEPENRMGAYQASLHEWLAKNEEVSNGVPNDVSNDLAL